MNFAQIREYTTGLIKRAFANKKQLDKIGESVSGTLTYDGTEINPAGTIINNTYNGKLSYADIYSTDEMIIGRWHNGKPIYKKTLKNLSISVAWNDKWWVQNNSPLNALIDDVDNIIKGIAYISTTTGILERSYINIKILPDNQWFLIFDNTMDSSDGTLDKITELTLQYTKSTDAENSFTPDMLEGASFSQNINYNNTLGYQDWMDTKERVIGRYIDGRPLYQKTYYATQADNPECWDDGGNVFFPFDGNTNQLVEAEGYYKYYVDDLGTQASYVNNTIRENADKSKITIRNTHQNTASPRSALLTVKYYKTTDTPDTFDPAMLENVIVDRTYTGEITYESYYNIGERVIGRWIDGKPIYRRLKKYDTPLHASWQGTTTIMVDTDSTLRCPNFLENAETPISAIVVGYTTLNSIRRKTCAPVSVRVEDNDWLYINFIANLASDGFNIEYLCIDYTKTTDAKNSFVPSLINNEEETIDIPAAIAADTIILNTYDSETEEEIEPEP